MSDLINKETGFILLGLLGVFCFSLTPIATRAAVENLNPIFVGIGRGVIAALFAAVILLSFKQRWPDRNHYRDIFVVAGSVVILFPMLLSIGMQYVPAAHTGVMLGILPLLTAVVSVIRSGEKVAFTFWLLSILGAGTVVIFSYNQDDMKWSMADAILILAIVIGAIGYSEGAKLGRQIGSWQVICWALVFSFPLLLFPFLYVVLTDEFNAPIYSWYGFAYLTIISQLFGFFPWYYALSHGGTVRISQLMLFMPFMTIMFSAYILGEAIGWEEWVFSIIIVFVVGLSFYIPKKSRSADIPSSIEVCKEQ